LQNDITLNKVEIQPDFRVIRLEVGRNRKFKWASYSSYIGTTNNQLIKNFKPLFHFQFNNIVHNSSTTFHIRQLKHNGIRPDMK